MSSEDIALSRAKIQLMRIPNTIFYTSILFSLKTVWSSKIETAATNGIHLYINPSFFLDLSEKMRIGVLVHEVSHVALNHMIRLRGKHQTIGNAAADHVINLSMLGTGKYQLPDWVLKDDRFTNMSTEQVYQILFDEAEESKAAGGAGAEGMMIPGGSDVIYPGDSVEADVIERAIASVVQKAAMTAKAEGGMPGDMPGEMEITIEELTNPVLPWNVILQNYFSNFTKSDYSWSKPNHIFMPEYYLPSLYSESVCNLAEAFDASGSVEPEEFSHFVNENKVIQELLRPDLVTVISFDTEITSIQEFTQETDLFKDLKFTGGGGTDIRPVLQWAIDNNPEVLLIFTDGEFEMPGPELHPTCPVVWLIHDNEDFTAPFGEIIFYDIPIY